MDKKLQVLKNQQADVFTEMSAVLATLAAPVRLRLVHFLSQAPLTVEVLAGKIDQTTANTSMHLRKMLNEGTVSVEVIAQQRLYSLNPAMFAFWEQCQDFIQHIDPTIKLDTSKIYGELNWSKNWDETLRLLKKKEVVLLDVRPTDEVEAPLSHALHIPGSDLKNKLAELPKKKDILVFCRGRMCALSAFSVNYLKEKGYSAYRLEKSWFAIKEDLEN